MQCYEEPDLEIDDGITHIFINTKGKNREDFSEEFLALMDYITNSDASVVSDSEYKNLSKIHNRVTQVRNSETMGVAYMQAWEEIEYEKDDAREEGRILGISEGRTLGISEGRAELKAEIFELINSGCSADEILQRLQNKTEK